jgi:hypothetical protein
MGPGGAGRARALVAGLIAAFAMTGAACGGAPEPAPTTPTSISPSPTHNVTPGERRCLNEGRFLSTVASDLVRVIPVQGATPGNEGMPAAIDKVRALLAELTAFAVHTPFVASRQQLQAAANDMIDAYEGLLSRGGHHRQDRVYQAQLTTGASLASSTAANVRVMRSRCVS